MPACVLRIDTLEPTGNSDKAEGTADVVKGTKDDRRGRAVLGVRFQNFSAGDKSPTEETVERQAARR